MNRRPFIVPVFIPHAGCPHRCVFCNQWIVSGQPELRDETEDELESMRAFLRFRGLRRGPTQLAFFGGNFLGLPQDRIRRLLTRASEWVKSGDCEGIRFSTRPDTVDAQTLDLIDAFPVTCVELGAQSMDDEVLCQTQRGHTAADTVAAVQRLRARGYDVGVQVMVGLPGDEEVRLLETGRRIVDLSPEFVRIYPTLVLAGSPLAKWYREGRYQALSLDEGVHLSMKLYRLFRQHGVRVIRTGLQATETLSGDQGVIAGPYHPAFGHLVQSACFLDAVRRALRRKPVSTDTIELRVHPGSISRARGQGNRNCAELRREFGFSAVCVVPEPALDEDVIALPEDRMINAYESN
jgi:histone acetyltransferase (RNA polymerase elongator complex component)